MAARPALAGRSPGVRLVPQIVAEWSSFPCVGGAAEEGIVMRHTSAEKRKSMTRTETNDTAVRVAAAGASMAPSQTKPGRNGRQRLKATRTKQAAAPRAESKGAQILVWIRRRSVRPSLSRLCSSRCRRPASRSRTLADPPERLISGTESRSTIWTRARGHP